MRKYKKDWSRAVDCDTCEYQGHYPKCLELCRRRERCISASGKLTWRLFWRCRNWLSVAEEGSE